MKSYTDLEDLFGCVEPAGLGEVDALRDKISSADTGGESSRKYQDKLPWLLYCMAQ
jgi:hypothetical protein